MEHHYPKKKVEMVWENNSMIQHLKKGRLVTLLRHTRDPVANQFQPGQVF